MDERWRRVIAAPLAFVIALLSALTILGAFVPKAYAATSEPTGLQAYIDGKPYSNFKVSDGANEAGFYSIESGSLEMKGLPEGWNYYYFDTFKQDDGTLTAGIGVTNGDKRYYWCFVGVSELAQSLDCLKNIRLTDVNAGGSEIVGFNPTENYTTTLDHIAFITIQDPSTLPYGWVVDVNQTGYTDWTVHPKGQSEPSVHWQIKSTCQITDSAPTPKGLQVKVNGTPLAGFDPLKGAAGWNDYIDASDITGGSGTVEVGGLPKGWAYRCVLAGDWGFSLEVTNGGITYNYYIKGVNKVKHNTSELQGVQLYVGGSKVNFDPTKNQNILVDKNTTYNDLVWDFNFSTDSQPNHSARCAIPSGWEIDWANLDGESTLADLTVHPGNESSPSVHWVIKKASSSGRGALTRIAGETRYETMSAMVDKFIPNEGGAAILASADNFPDALAASSLSGTQNAPIILTSASSLSDEARKQLQAIKPNKLYIVGGEAAISREVEQSAVSAASCQNATRFAGDTRYETALKIADGIDQNNGTVIIATGENFADALSVSPYAQHFKAPIVLSSPNSGLSDEAINMIKSKGFSNAIILGGTSAVPDAVNQQLSAAGTSNVQRLQGDTRYETSAIIAEFEKSQGMTANGVVFATGSNFPDALVAGPFAGKNNSMVLLADDATIQWAAKYREDVNKAFIAGGPSAVSEDTANIIASYLNLEYAS